MRKFWFSSALVASAAAGALLLGACKAQDGAGAAQQSATVGQSAPQQPAAPAAQQQPAAQAGQPADGVRRLGPAELQKMIEAGEAVAVDVRSQGSFDQGHIKGSLSIPRKELPSRLSELPKDKLVVFYCA